MPNGHSVPPTGGSFWANVLAALQRVIDQRGRVSAMFRLKMEGERGTPQEWVLFYTVFGSLFGIPAGFLTFDNAASPIAATFAGLVTSPAERSTFLGQLGMLIRRVVFEYGRFVWAAVTAILTWLWVIAQPLVMSVLKLWLSFAVVCWMCALLLRSTDIAAWPWKVFGWLWSLLPAKVAAYIVKACINLAFVVVYSVVMFVVQYWKLFWHAQLVFAGAKRPGDAIAEFASASADLAKDGLTKVFDGLRFTHT